MCQTDEAQRGSRLSAQEVAVILDDSMEIIGREEEVACIEQIAQRASAANAAAVEVVTFFVDSLIHCKSLQLSRPQVQLPAPVDDRPSANVEPRCSSAIEGITTVAVAFDWSDEDFSGNEVVGDTPKKKHKEDSEKSVLIESITPQKQLELHSVATPTTETTPV